MEKIRIEVDKVILYYMDRVDPDGNLYRFYVYKGMIGRIGGIFYDFLAKRNERREAFGGRKFDIVLDNGEIEKCEGQWWDAVTDRAREELEKEGNPLSKMVLIGVSSVDRLLDCYVYYGLWASKSKRGMCLKRK